MTKFELQHRTRYAALTSLFLVAPLWLTANQAQAQDFGKGEDESGLHYVLGGAAMYAPTYEGSKDYEVSAVPFFVITYGNRATFDLGGLQYDIYESGPMTLTAKLGYDMGRSEDDSPYLAGLGDIDGGVNLGFGVDYTLGEVNLYADIDKTIDGSDGLTGTFGAEYSRPVGPVMLAVGASAMWADDNYMQSYFGISADQSAASGYSQYGAGAGFKSVGLEMSATYFLNEHWIVRGQLSLSELIGDAADSPIVQETTQSSAMAMIAYKF